MTAPRVTIGMPVYNSRPALFEAAFAALLAQDYGDFELVISDNGSSPEAAALYEAAAKRDPRVRVVRHGVNYGAVFNFNYLVSVARGEFFMWAADDDLRAPGYLRQTVALLDAHPEAVSAGCRVRLVDASGEKVGQVDFGARFTRRQPWERIRVGARMSPSDYMDVYALHRRSALQRTHVSQPIHGADCLMVMELLLQGTIEHADEELFSYTVPTSYSMESLSLVMLGAHSKPMFFRHGVQHLALQMLVSVATMRIDLSAAARTRCLTELAAALLRHGWLTEESTTELQREAAANAYDGKLLRSAGLIARSLLQSPPSLVSLLYWRRLIAIFRHYPTPI